MYHLVTFWNSVQRNHDKWHFSKTRCPAQLLWRYVSSPHPTILASIPQADSYRPILPLPAHPRAKKDVWPLLSWNKLPPNSTSPAAITDNMQRGLHCCTTQKAQIESALKERAHKIEAVGVISQVEVSTASSLTFTVPWVSKLQSTPHGRAVNHTHQHFKSCDFSLKA